MVSGLPVAASADAGLAFQGRVYAWSTGQGVANADVLVYNASDLREVRTDKSGRFVVFGLEADRYTVVVRHAGYDDRCALLDVAPGETEYATIVLPPDNIMVDGCGSTVRDSPSYIVF
jgi:hypothetical protein